MKVAIVCDWLTNVGGAEKVLLRVHQLYPEAPIYTSKYSPRGIDWFRDAEVKTGWLNIFPAKLRRLLGPLRMRWFSRLDLSDYDLIISVTGAEAKAVRASKPGARHVCYCHAPTQYYWQMYDDYVRDPGFGILNPVVRVFFRALVRGQRRKDFEAASRVDQFVTISQYTQELIRKYYKRDAVVVHPPVEVAEFGGLVRGGYSGSLGTASLYYIVTSRQVTWKRLDLAVMACVKLGRELLVVGEGPEHKRLTEIARGRSSVKFLPLATSEELAKLLAGARGYLFPSMEPFGIAPVEALSVGCPVIAYGKGGALDYVEDGVNGILFKSQTAKSLEEAIVRFEKMKFDKAKVAASADRFAAERFDTELREIVDKVMSVALKKQESVKPSVKKVDRGDKR